MANTSVNVNDSVLEVLKVLDSTGIGFLTVLDNSKKVVGIITDGDIRRGFINGFGLSDDLGNFINHNFFNVVEGEMNLDIFRQCRNNKLRAVPFLTTDGELIDVLNFTEIKSILPIDAVIMAGGLGTRLQPFTNNTPKPLLKVGDKEIISYNFDRLNQFGINNQYITVNYLGEQIADFCKDYNEKINFTIVTETQFYGTAGSLALINTFENDTVLLMNSDLLTNIDYEDFYLSFKEKNADIMVASIPYEVNLPYAILESENNHVSSFKEKPSYTYYANAGIYLMKKEIAQMVPKNTVFNATDLMDTVIKEGKKIIHYPITGYWLDIGKHEDFEKAQKDIAHIDFD